MQAQLVRWLKAKAWVDQAKSILEVNNISLREYRDGIYPQDLQLVRQYIQTCKIEKERAERNAAWSTDMFQKGYRTAAQLKADTLNDQQTSIALREAEGMLERLDKFTGPKILKSLEAKVMAVESDKKIKRPPSSLRPNAAIACKETSIVARSVHPMRELSST